MDDNDNINNNNNWFRCMCEACADLKERNFMKQFEARRCNFCDGPVIGNTGAYIGLHFFDAPHRRQTS